MNRDTLERGLRLVDLSGELTVPGQLYPYDLYPWLLCFSANEIVR